MKPGKGSRQGGGGQGMEGVSRIGFGADTDCT